MFRRCYIDFRKFFTAVHSHYNFIPLTTVNKGPTQQSILSTNIIFNSFLNFREPNCLLHLERRTVERSYETTAKTTLSFLREDWHFFNMAYFKKEVPDDNIYNGTSF